MKQKEKILLLGVGLVGVYFLFIKKPVAATVITPINDDGTGQPALPPPPPPVYSTGLDSGLVADVINHENDTLLHTYYNTIYSLPTSVFDKVHPVMETLLNQGKLSELKTIADYITNFLSRGVPLTRTPQYQELYDAMISIHNTYGIF